MKNKIKFTGILIMSLMLWISSAVGQTTICFDLSITDNCGTPWGGTYSANVSVYMNDVFQCSHLFTGLGLTSLNKTFDCDDLELNYTDRVYEIKIEACREQTPPTCCGHGTSNLIYYSGLVSCNTAIYVTLE